jgi:hypothetical protein
MGLFYIFKPAVVLLASSVVSLTSAATMLMGMVTGALSLA